MGSKALFSLAAFSVVACGVGLVFPSMAHTERGRSPYREISPQEFEQRFFTTQLPPHLSDDALYSIAIAVFGRYTGEREGRQSESIEIKYDQEGGAIATITAIGLADDSVGAVRMRLDFMRDNELGWQLVWVGTQQQCHRGRGNQNWTAAPCP